MDIIKALYSSDLVAEDTIQHWYKKVRARRGGARECLLHVWCGVRVVHPVHPPHQPTLRPPPPRPQGSHPKGRNVFLKDMEPFIRWLDEASEEEDEEDE